MVPRQHKIWGPQGSSGSISPHPGHPAAKGTVSLESGQKTSLVQFKGVGGGGRLRLVSRGWRMKKGNLKPLHGRGQPGKSRGQCSSFILSLYGRTLCSRLPPCQLWALVWRRRSRGRGCKDLIQGPETCQEARAFLLQALPVYSKEWPRNSALDVDAQEQDCHLWTPF